MEQWRRVPEYEGIYEVSDQGRVKSVARTVARRSRWGGTLEYPIAERILQPGKHADAYLTVCLYRDGHIKTISVHTLVLTAFVGPRPEGQEACHLSNVKSDNRLRNLLWDTPPANMRDQLLAGHWTGATLTHCSKGHEYTEANTRTEKSGGRHCRECERIWRRGWLAANRDKINARKRERRRQRGITP